MVEKFRRDAVWICRLTAEHRSTVSALHEVDSRSDRINSLAAHVPWYPRGFTGYGDGLAWEWIDNNDCGYSDGYCWGIWLVSRDGCPSGVYAEVNIKSGGVVIDYSNDSLGSLAANDVAKLDFVAFEDGYGTLTAQITDINCY